jgi:hypothetical protein
MNPGPAPALVTDWFTWAFVLTVVAVFTLVVLTVEILKARETLSQERLDALADDTPAPYDDTCAIGDCTRPAAVLFPSSTGVMFVCRFHAAQVAEWTGPALFDQEDGVA